MMFIRILGLAAVLLLASFAASATAPTWTYSCGMSSSGFEPGGSFTSSAAGAGGACGAVQGCLINGPIGQLEPSAPCTPCAGVSSGTFCSCKFQSATTWGPGPPFAHTRPAGADGPQISCSEAPTCQTGFVYSQGSCVKSGGAGCNKDGPQIDVFVRSSAASPVGLKVNSGGCLYEPAQVTACKDGQGNAGFCGKYAPTGQENDAGSGAYGAGSGGRSSGPGGGPTDDSTGPGSGGARGNTENFNAADGDNLRKIATNTATGVSATDAVRAELQSQTGRLEAVIGENTSSTGQKLQALETKLSEIKSAVENQKGGSCGGEGQPACKTESAFKEDGVESAGKGGLDILNGKLADIAKDYTKLNDSLKMENAPKFAPDGGAWTFSLTSLLPSPNPQSCDLTESIQIAGKSVDIGAKACSFAPYIHEFGYWAMYCLTAFGLWAIFFMRRE